MESTLKDRAYYVAPGGEHTGELIGFDVSFERRQEATHRIIGGG